jgi:hypothetical protein
MALLRALIAALVNRLIVRIFLAGGDLIRAALTPARKAKNLDMHFGDVQPPDCKL